MTKVVTVLYFVFTCAAHATGNNLFCDLNAVSPTFEIHLAESWNKDGLRPMKVFQREETIYVYKDAVMTRADFENARKIADEYGRPAVEMMLTESGFKKMVAVTKGNLHKQVAIILDGNVISAPVIEAPLSKRQLTITGQFSELEASNLATCINRK